jgi:hypothetical protein
MIQQRINSFLLPKVKADKSLYVEFDLTEKLKGSFEERASILQSAVGGPWMTRNEARADNNLPPVEHGDELIVPLNVVEGGQASPQDTHMDEQQDMTTVDAEPVKMRSKAQSKRVRVGSSEEEDQKLAEVLSKFFKRQADSVLPKIGAKADNWWNQHRWDEELAADIEPLINELADRHGADVAKVIGSKYSGDQTRAYLKTLSEGRAAAINESTKRKLEEAMEYEGEDEENHTPAHVMDVRSGEHADLLGHALAIAAIGWAGLHEAPQQARQQGIRKTVKKVWVTGANARDTHAALNGVEVDVDEPFPNGALWPGDDDLSPDESCGCNCATEIVIEEE